MPKRVKVLQVALEATAPKTAVLGAVRIALDMGRPAPELLPLHPFGEFVGNGIPLHFDDESLRLANAALQTRGNPWVLDWHHATLKAEQATPGPDGTLPKAPAAGWITSLEVHDGYVYGRVQYTEQGRADVASGAMGYVSPVLLYTEDDGHVVGYHSHALTNNPGTYWQRRIGLELTPANPPQKESRMDKKLLCKALGIAEDSTDEQINQRLIELQARGQFADFVVQSLGLQAASLTPEVRTRVVALAANEGVLDEVKGLRIQIADVQKRQEGDKVLAALEAAQADGRIPADKESPEYKRFQRLLSLDFDTTKAQLDSMAKLVPTQLPKVDAKGQAQAALEASDLEVAGLLGVKAEDLAKYGGK
jgi:phage I-like protein